MKPVFSSRDWLKKKTLWSKIALFFNKKIHSIKNIFYREKNSHSSYITNTPRPHRISARSTQASFISRWHMWVREKLSHKKGRPTPHKNVSPKKGKKVLLFLGKALLLLFVLSIIGVIGVFLYFSKDLPEPGKVNTRFIAESTKIYDRTGEVLLYEIHGEEKRTIIPFEDMPDTIKHATIALEDRDFYTHHGIRPKAIIRAVLSQAFGVGTPSGGSTITQQLVKNSILTNERSLTRKIKEAILAIEIELKFSKDEILGMYLNEIPYGSNAYGVEAAAQTFFNKNAKDLTIDEAAVLAALPQAPSRYSPYGSQRELLKGRQNYAITQMAELHYISAEDAEQSIAADVFSKLARSKENIKAPHFVFYIRDQIEELYGSDYLEENGLTIITTLDWGKQEIAERIVKEKAFTNKDAYNAENAALVAIDPATGEIITMVGSRDYFDEEIDGNVNVAIRDRQPGSSFKPYAYLLSFIKGYTPETLLFDVETDFPLLDQGKSYTPQNYDGSFRGPLKVKDALAMSLNIPAVKILYLAGVKDTITFAKSLGITSLNDVDRYGLALVLGGGEVKLVDHVSAFSVFANNGVQHKKSAILEIRDKDGNVIQKNEKISGEQLVEERYIGMLSHILSTNSYRVPAFGTNNPLRFDNRPVAAKTGTTNENRDAWTIGYTPDVAIGVWAGNNDNSSMNSRGVGANTAAPIFREFLLEAYPEPSGKEFPSYDATKEKTNKDVLDGVMEKEKKEDVCLISSKKETYCYVNKYCPDDRKKERLIIKEHNILHYVNKEDPRGDEPKTPKDDPFYTSWEKGVENFYKKDPKVIFDTDLNDCERDDFDDYKPEISISKLELSDNVLTIKTDVDSPFDIKNIIYTIDGKTISSEKSKEVKYTIPANQNNTTLSIEVTLRDEIDNVTMDKKEKTVSFTVSE